MRKPKTVEVCVRVRVPKHWSAAHTRKQLADAWYGSISAEDSGPFGRFDEIVIHPRWGSARIIKKENS